MSLPGKPPEQPLWNHAYFFSHRRDKATLFTPGAALVIELYGATEGRFGKAKFVAYLYNKRMIL